MFRDKVRVTPGKEQICDDSVVGKITIFSSRESLEATMSPWPVVPTEVSVGTLEKSQHVEHLASATYGYGNAPGCSPGY